MTEKSYFWGGQSIGDALGESPYSFAKVAEIMRSLFVINNATHGVIFEYLNSLEVTWLGSDIYVSAGAGLVNGRFYRNDNVVMIGTVATPSSGTNKYTAVLRSSESAQTIRGALLGPSASYPVVAQTEIVWELPLAEIDVTAAGAITIYDRRRMLALTSHFRPLMLQRQGGSSTLWQTYGTNTYSVDYGNMMILSLKDTVLASSGTITMADIWNRGKYYGLPPTKPWIGFIISSSQWYSAQCYADGTENMIIKYQDVVATPNIFSAYVFVIGHVRGW